MNNEPDDFEMYCAECGEFDCDTDHEDYSQEDYQDDDWFFDGSGMVGDD